MPSNFLRDLLELAHSLEAPRPMIETVLMCFKEIEIPEHQF